MRRALTLAAVTALIVAAGAAQAQSSKAKAQTSPSARLDGKPNLNGIWQAVNSANWNLEPHSAAEAPVASRQIGAWGAVPAGVGVIDGETIPYKPEALGQRDENRKAGPAKDPEASCYLPGIPRATYMSFPFQIIQGGAKGDMLMVYEYAAANRTVVMKPVDVPPIDTWMGTSFGAWEGDTLKVVTLGQNGMAWLDRSGNYLTPTATVTERFKMVDANHIDYEATIEDPSVFVKPWKITMPLYRRMEPNAQLMEFRCVPFSEELLYGDLQDGREPKK